MDLKHFKNTILISNS